MNREKYTQDPEGIVVNPQKCFSYSIKDFTQKELDLLAERSKSDHPKKYNMVSVSYYITPVNKNGISLQYNSREDFPIFIYRLEDYIKVFQPCSYLFRFFYVDKKLILEG